MDALRSRVTNLAGQSLIAVVLFAFVALVGRLIYINAQHGPSLLARAQRQQCSDIPLIARRGVVADCEGRMLSGTILRKSVFADPQVLPDKEKAAKVLASILNLDAAELTPDLLAAGERRFFVVHRGVSESQAERIKKAGIYGLGLFSEPYRTYPMDTLAASLIGFVAPDGKGVSGLEFQCDAWLSGENGVKTIIRDARRKAFWLAEDGYRPARDGFHIVLTIDAEIQSAVEKELAAGVERYDAEAGIAVVMDPATGAILAMANYPGFDPNQYGDFATSLYRNRAITDPYEPGSTFKPFIAAAALAEGVVRFGEMFDCEGGEWKDGPRTLRDHHPYEYLTFEEVLIKSSNIGMGKIGKRLGNERLHRYVKRFGFGEKTGVNLLGESVGILRELHDWTAFSTTSIPMGQEISVTAIQLARGFCAFANGGMLVQPYVIQAVVDAEGNVINDFTPPPPETRALPEAIITAMKDRVLTEVVNTGNPTNAGLANYQVFGKTGTAQIARKDGRGYEKNAYVSSFVAGAPASHPRLVAYVAVRKPNKSIGYYGGRVAAPVVRNILNHSLAYLQVEPDIRHTQEYVALPEDMAAE